MNRIIFVVFTLLFLSNANAETSINSTPNLGALFNTVRNIAAHNAVAPSAVEPSAVAPSDETLDAWARNLGGRPNDDIVNCRFVGGSPMPPQYCETRRRIAERNAATLKAAEEKEAAREKAAEEQKAAAQAQMMEDMQARKAKLDEEARLAAEKQAEENKRNLQLQEQAHQPFLNAQAKYSAIDARDLVMAPKVKADGKNYVVSNAYLEKSVSDRTFIASIAPIQAGYLGFNTRFVVLVPNNLLSKYQNNARVGGGFALIGKYIGNRELNLVNGSAVTVPVFEMLYLD